MRRILLGAITSGVSVGLLAVLVDWRSALRTLGQANLAWIAVAVLLIVVSWVAKAIRWRWLLPGDPNLGTARLYRILHVSLLLNAILPIRLGDVARVVMTKSHSSLRVGHIVGSLAAERVTDAATLFVCFWLVSPFLDPGTKAARDVLTALAIAGAVVAGGVAGVVLLRRRFAPLFWRLSAAWGLAEEGRAFREAWRQVYARDRAAAAWVWAVVGWVAVFAANYAALRALHIDAPFAVAVLITVTTNVVTLIPSSPGFVGVFHATATVTLVPFDVDSAHALSFAVLAHLLVIAPASLQGLAFVTAGREPLPLLGVIRGRETATTAGGG